jgi:hypothetical protein
MTIHFRETAHQVTKTVVCECGRKFPGGTNGGFYYHRYCNANGMDTSVCDLVDYAGVNVPKKLVPEPQIRSKYATPCINM